MSGRRAGPYLEWGVRLVVLALLALWVISPPQDRIRSAAPVGVVR